MASKHGIHASKQGDGGCKVPSYPHAPDGRSPNISLERTKVRLATKNTPSEQLKYAFLHVSREFSPLIKITVTCKNPKSAIPANRVSYLPAKRLTRPAKQQTPPANVCELGFCRKVS